MGQPFNPKWNGSGYDGPLDTDQSGVSLKKINKILEQGISIDGSDIQLGAVEIKSGDADVRANVNSRNELLVEIQKRGALSNASGIVAAGGTAQTALAADTDRFYLFIQNPTTKTGGTTETESLWFDIGSTAVLFQPSIELAPGQSICYETAYIPTGEISVKAATTGHQFVIKYA